jgi:hypothetical protein
VSDRIEPVGGVRVEPALAMRRVERRDRDQPRDERREQEEREQQPPEPEEDEGLHIDVQA